MSGFTAPLVSGETSKTDNFIKLAGPAANGTVVSLAGLPLDQMPGGPGYKQRYEKRFGSKVSMIGVTTRNLAYDARGDLKVGGITVYKVVDGQWMVLESVGGGSKRRCPACQAWGRAGQSRCAGSTGGVDLAHFTTSEGGTEMEAQNPR